MSFTVDNITVRYSCDYPLDICPYLVLAQPTLHANANYYIAGIVQFPW